MNGVINFLKPPGMSSNGAVVFLRGVLGVKKTGHAGTLDPGACGVLPVCVGKATRISSCLMGGKKEYIAELSFGRKTDTGDSYGNVTHTSDAPFPSAEDVSSALTLFLGQTTQITPAYSAVKHEGQKLYKLARSGIEVPVKEREIMIHEAAYLRQMHDTAHLLRFVCGKGTYVRTLCEDIAAGLGHCGYMSLLVRTKCAGLDISDAHTADEIKQMQGAFDDALLPTDIFLGGLPRIDMDAGHRRMLLNGAPVSYGGEDMEEARIYISDEFLGIGCAQKGLLKISTLLVDNENGKDHAR